MIKFDDELLIELGLNDLSLEEKTKMKAHIFETLETRVGVRLASNMSEAQLNDFEQFINNKDESGAFNWLETNFPNYKEAVADEFNKLKIEIKELAPQIIEASK
jgi:Zn-dependent M16 (insulinase) family peptidase